MFLPNETTCPSADLLNLESSRRTGVYITRMYHLLKIAPMMMKIIFVTLVLVNSSIACLSSGASGCCCGASGGCHRARARAAKTANLEGLDSPLLLTDVRSSAPIAEGLGLWTWDLHAMSNDSRYEMSNPNNIFRQCCVDRQLPAGCVSKCNYNKYTKESLVSMYSGFDRCPVKYAPEMHFCAAQGKDHRQCCGVNGVGTTLAGQKCLAFCDQTPDKFTPLDLTYMPCLDRFEQMKRCFYSDTKQRAEDHFLQYAFQTQQQQHEPAIVLYNYDEMN